jgi:hypothetical protein
LAERDRAHARAASPAAGVFLLTRRNCFIIANLTGDDIEMEISALTATAATTAISLPEWQAPLFATTAREFGGSGALPQIGQNSLMLPARGLFLYIMPSA